VNEARAKGTKEAILYVPLPHTKAMSTGVSPPNAPTPPLQVSEQGTPNGHDPGACTEKGEAPAAAAEKGGRYTRSLCVRNDAPPGHTHRAKYRVPTVSEDRVVLGSETVRREGGSRMRMAAERT